MMANTELLFEMLKNDLSAPRVLLEQVVSYIQDHYNYPSAELRRFFQEKFPSLEDYEVDLTFSPQFTPAEHNRLDYIPALGAKALSVSEVALLKQRLIDAQLETAFRAPDDVESITVPVHEVFIDRYVNLLRLEQKIPEMLYAEIMENVPSVSHHEINLMAREDVWQSEERQRILAGFLRAMKARDSFSTMKISFLTNFMRTYRPADLADVDRKLESLIASCQVDMENVAGRGFHDEYLKALNEGNMLAKNAERDVWAHYRHMMDMASLLREDFQAIAQAAPEIWELSHQPGSAV